MNKMRSNVTTCKIFKDKKLAVNSITTSNNDFEFILARVHLAQYYKDKFTCDDWFIFRQKCTNKILFNKKYQLHL